MFHFIVVKFQRLKISIRYKVGVAFGLVLATFIINGCLSIWQLGVIQEANNRQKTLSLTLEQVQSVRLLFQAQVENYSDTVFITRNSKFRDRFRSYIFQEISRPQNIYSDEKSFEVQFAKLYTVAFDKFVALENAVLKEDFKEAVKLWQTSAPTFDQITEFLNNYNQELKANLSVAEKALRDAVFLALLLIIGFTVLSVILVILLLVLIAKAIIEPLRRLSAKLKDVSSGNLTYQLKIYNRDEIGGLAESLQNALSSLQQVINGVRINESLQTVIQQLTALSNQQSSGAQEQVTNLNQVSASVQELRHTAGLIANNAGKVSELTLQTLDYIRNVAVASQQSHIQNSHIAETVEQTIEGIEKIGGQVDSFTATIAQLNRQSEAIGKIVNLIKAIADEVHLLSFNAAIESAHAGQFGDRFRVVAREIKILAARTNKAAQEAQEMITTVQNSSKIALLEVETGRDEVKTVIQSNSGLRSSLLTLAGCSAQVDQAVKQLNDFAATVSNQVEEISTATRQQQVSQEQVLQALRSVGLIAEENSTASQQIVGSSQELQKVALQLNSVLSGIVLAA